VLLVGAVACVEEPALVVSDYVGADNSSLLVGAVACVEEPTPVVGDYVGADDSGLGWNEVAPGGLLHGVLGESPLRIELEELVEFAEFVEDELVEGEILERGFMVLGSENRRLWYHLLATGSWIEEREENQRDSRGRIGF
jgi:hypothetical protein